MPNLPQNDRLIQYYVLAKGKLQRVGCRKLARIVAKQFNLNG
ncbi:hypothetical protein [Chlorogloea sp. CCALA 695]|nr:hypothetical protein [Chlorogloea sp. CCALA 695]